MSLKRKIISLVMIFVLILCAVIVAVLIYCKDEENLVPSVDTDKLNIEELVEETETLFPEGWEADYIYNPSPTGIKEKTKSLLHLNEDIAGWIKIDGTRVDYPVLFDHKFEESDYNDDEEYAPNSYYLHKGLDGEYLYAGSLFMDYRNVFGSDEEMQSENIVIYGHNMGNDTMFGSLSYYRQDYNFYAENPIIQFSSNYRDYQYVIFGFIITSGNGDTDFRYWDMEELDTEDDFNYYVDRIIENSLVDTGVDVKYGDKLLTLSTCYSDADNSRFIVVARRLRKNETSMDNIDRTKAYIEEQSGTTETS